MRGWDLELPPATDNLVDGIKEGAPVPLPLIQETRPTGDPGGLPFAVQRITKHKTGCLVTFGPDPKVIHR